MSGTSTDTSNTDDRLWNAITRTLDSFASNQAKAKVCETLAGLFNNLHTAISVGEGVGTALSAQKLATIVGTAWGFGAGVFDRLFMRTMGHYTAERQVADIASETALLITATQAVFAATVTGICATLWVVDSANAAGFEEQRQKQLADLIAVSVMFVTSEGAKALSLRIADKLLELNEQYLNTPDDDTSGRNRRRASS
jgi:hypothetical protein